MDIPFTDLKAQHAPIRDELLHALTSVLDSGVFGGGAQVAQFEEAFAAYCGARYAVAVSSGTDALLLSLLASGIGPGDEVITVPNTFIATAEAISLSGARPVLVDVDEVTGLIDPDAAAAAITRATSAIIPVHLHGHPADMARLLEISRRHALLVIEDACQAHGSLYRGRHAGTLGHAGCFSFYPGKNLGGLGDGGAVITDDAALAQRLRALREHGQTRKHVHTSIGWTARMDAVQAAVLSVKLPRLDLQNETRRRLARDYTLQLAGIEGLVTPVERAPARTNVHVYNVRSPARDELLRHLAAAGVSCGIHYPTPIHLQPAYAHLGLPASSFPAAERFCAESLSLPLHPCLGSAELSYIAEAVHTWARAIGCVQARVA